MRHVKRLFLVRLLGLSAVTSFREAWTHDRSNVVQLAGGGTLLLAYFAMALHDYLSQKAPVLQPLWHDAERLILLGAAAAGIFSGAAAAAFLMRRAFAPWLAAQPLGLSERMSAILCAGTGFAILSAAVVLLAVWLCAIPAGHPHPMFLGGGGGAAFLCGSMLGGGLRLLAFHRRAATNEAVAVSHFRLSEIECDEAAARQPGFLAPFDRQPPRWIGHWAMGYGSLFTIEHFGLSFEKLWRASFPLVLAIGGAVLVAASVINRQAVLAAIAAGLGGHLLFIGVLRCDPLVSPVLKTTPVGFARAWLGLMRLPFLLSILWALPISVVAVAVDTTLWWVPQTVLLFLGVANLCYAAFAAHTPQSRKSAILAYGAAWIFCAYESVEYGRLIFALFFAAAGLALFRAIQRYRVNV